MKKAVVVLGMRFNGPDPSHELAGRIENGLKAFERTDSNFIIFTGGFTNRDLVFSEAYGMEKYARKISEGKLKGSLLEEQAMDTLGNGLFSSQIIRQLGIQVAYIVTSCYHEERSLYIFRHSLPESVEVSSIDCYKTDGGNSESERIQLAECKMFFQELARSGSDPIKYLLKTKKYRKN